MRRIPFQGRGVRAGKARRGRVGVRHQDQPAVRLGLRTEPRSASAGRHRGPDRPRHPAHQFHLSHQAAGFGDVLRLAPGCGPHPGGARIRACLHRHQRLHPGQWLPARHSRHAPRGAAVLACELRRPAGGAGARGRRERRGGHGARERAGGPASLQHRPRLRPEPLARAAHRAHQRLHSGLRAPVDRARGRASSCGARIDGATSEPSRSRSARAPRRTC